MTVTQIVDSARNNLNALTDTLWTDSELYVNLYKVMLKVARKTRCIQAQPSANTVAATSDYTMATTVNEITRVTYAGAKLQYIDRRQLDSINPSSTTSSGTPAYYLVRGRTVTLYPTPSAVGAYIIYSNDIPSAIPTAATTLEIPTAYHDVLVDGLTSMMCPKDLGNPLTDTWQAAFNRGMAEMEADIKKKRRGDRFAIVQVEENSLNTEFGII